MLPDKNLPKILLSIILLICLLLRVSQIDYPFAFKWGDGERDTLVANHIVSYQEYPLIGPHGLLSEKGLHNSPFYYYFLAFFLYFYNSPITLALLNISLQLLTLVILYLLGKNLFGEKVALLSTLLFGLNPHLISQSEYIWQPYVSQPFGLTSFYLLFLAFSKKIIFF
ncbi:phospholipid carrier-dependent glycosyltransferase [Candidatus Gottesmanbacteria bacterium]|nr:phospholipid carrier-dependent glycosyltransferase [Candidatus Gottesmanbacteria bacterium]